MPPDLSQYDVRQGEVTVDDVVELDGKWFDGCTFTRCTLVFRGIKPFGYAKTEIAECRFRFEGAARLTIATLVALMPGILTDDDVRTVLQAAIADQPTLN